jgi:pyruvate/2-oxoacid:ferredoxin oxidoreductase beta subunit
MNTGVQRSGATPFDASTTTSPAGKVSFGNQRPKKNMPAIMAAHGSPYVATTSVAYPKDMIRKVKTATETVGPAYIHAHAPCTTGWGFDTSKTVEIGKLAVETALWPMFEMEDGEVTKVQRSKRSRTLSQSRTISRCSVGSSISLQWKAEKKRSKRSRQSPTRISRISGCNIPEDLFFLFFCFDIVVQNVSICITKFTTYLSHPKTQGDF